MSLVACSDFSRGENLMKLPNFHVNRCTDFATVLLLFVQPFLGKSVFLVFKLWLFVLLVRCPAFCHIQKGESLSAVLYSPSIGLFYTSIGPLICIPVLRDFVESTGPRSYRVSTDSPYTAQITKPLEVISLSSLLWGHCLEIPGKKHRIIFLFWFFCFSKESIFFSILARKIRLH